ncbi:SDR family NAD(P)-dependent oxidoreductase [Paraburkholderia kururiensis]|uniref:SDR family oxidoreductase n=1 Tax=Paraburkholderia kururiensis TaxID=984307 RepID=UPI0039A51A86
MPFLSRTPKVVVVTGASAGVGRATALCFAQRGANVALIARDAEALETVAEGIRQLGARALPIALDMSDADAVHAAADRVERELGPIDVWVNNAMVTVFAPITEIEPAEFARVTDVTYHGYVWGTMAALAHMRPRNRGTIVQVGSALAYRAIPLQSAYCGAKFAIRGFTDALRSELLHEKSRVHVTMVQMPALNTPQFDWALCRLPGEPRPVAPVYEPEVAARAIFWAATHKRRELDVGFSSVKAIFANRIAPAWLDRYLAHHAWRGQQRKTPTDPARPVDLWDPVPDKHRLRGAFGDEARATSAALWLDTHRRTALAAATLALAALFACRRRGGNV